jgi:hypothetical protein
VFFLAVNFNENLKTQGFKSRKQNGKNIFFIVLSQKKKTNPIGLVFLFAAVGFEPLPRLPRFSLSVPLKGTSPLFSTESGTFRQKPHRIITEGRECSRTSHIFRGGYYEQLSLQSV